jgi:hypothetical protein
MKKFLKIFTLLVISHNFGYLFAATTPMVVLEDVEISKESANWLKVAVKFKFPFHPLQSKYQRSPKLIEDFVNLNYIDDVKVKLYICFSNETKKATLRSLKKSDAEYYQYYSSEIEFLALKYKNNTSFYANFLFPIEIAERDGFISTYVKHIGHAVEISIGGIPLEFPESERFLKYDPNDPIEKNYIGKFKQQAQQNSSKNEGFLIPAHIISSKYLEGAGPVRRKISSH